MPLLNAPKRRWLRFSLRTLFLATLLAAACLAVSELVHYDYEKRRPDLPPLPRLMFAAVLFWIAGCGLGFRTWRRRNRIESTENQPARTL
jgi:hypothetical protein